MKVILWMTSAALAAPPAVDGLLAQYRAEGAAPDPARGAAQWAREVPGPDGARSCTTCHGPTLGAAGRHAKTGEPIEAMTAPGRLSDAAKIEKWFGRNCRWTWGRDCTAAEKADFLAYLTGGAR